MTMSFARALRVGEMGEDQRGKVATPNNSAVPSCPSCPLLPDEVSEDSENFLSSL